MKNSNLSNFSSFIKITDQYLDPQKVRVALDVGSRDAEIALCLKEHYPNSKVYAFECNPQAIELCKKNILQQQGVFLVEQAVADVTGTLDFYAIDPENTVTTLVDGNIGASSLYVANPEYPLEKYAQNKISVPSTTLWDWAMKEGIDQIDVIWIDLQGAELRAFQGLKDLLKSVIIIYTEVEYQQIYRNQPLANEVQNYLSTRGFLLVKKMHTNEWFGDQLYFHNTLVPWWLKFYYKKEVQQTLSLLERIKTKILSGS